MLALVPRGADPEHRASAGQDVQGRHDLREQSGVPVGHAGDQRLQLDGAGVGGEEAQGGVRLEHRRRRVAQTHAFHLEVVVHDRQVVQTGFLRRTTDLGHGRRDRRDSSGKTEVHQVHADSHRDSLRGRAIVPTTSCLRRDARRTASRFRQRAGPRRADVPFALASARTNRHCRSTGRG